MSEVLTVPEVAARLRVRRPFVYQLFKAGVLEGFRAGRSVRIFASSVDNYVDARSNVRGDARAPRPRPAPTRGRLTFYG